MSGSNRLNCLRGIRLALGATVLALGMLALLAVSGLRADEIRGDPAPAPPATLPQAPTAPVPVPPLSSPQPQVPLMRRFQFPIAPNTPLKDLLPTPPAAAPASLQVIGDLTRVPEIKFQAPLAKDLTNEEAFKQTAYAIAKINHLNQKKADHFMDILRGQRPDLNGLPFAMGDACRTKGERSREFNTAVNLVRGAMRPQMAAPINPPPMVRPTSVTEAPNTSPAPFLTAVAFSPVAANAEHNPADGFWARYEAACKQDDQRLARIDRDLREHVTQARIAALMQILAPEVPSMRLGLVQHLATLSHVEATRALARLAVFALEEEVRQGAVEALKVRRERDYTETLVQALRYPWPAVARNAADAIVRLERADLQKELVALLDEPDPRAPRIEDGDQQKRPVIRELVRINHHRNCLLCHAPGNTPSVSPEALTAAVPVPTEPLPSPSDGYRQSSPDVLVRVDVTYLRQDFSMYQAVGDANPWPEMQRFDFLVRTRTLTVEEATACRQELTAGQAGRPSPYQRAALAALREMTGMEGEPTAAAWRKLLNQPAP